MATGEALLKEAEARIRASENVDLWRNYVARLDAEELMAKALKREVTAKDLRREVPPAAERRFRSYVERRESGEPVAQIRGEIEFRGMRLLVRNGVFTPRLTTESLAGAAIDRLRGHGKVVAVDVACGAGAVSLAIANEVPRAHAYGVDISKPAIALCRQNARRLGLENTTFKAGDMLAPLPDRIAGRVDVMTMHPPYVTRSQVRTLSVEIRGFEPAHTLTDQSNDGLGLVRTLLPAAPGWLRPGGWLIFEVAPDISRSLKTLMTRAGFKEVTSRPDELGATRIVSGRS